MVGSALPSGAISVTTIAVGFVPSTIVVNARTNKIYVPNKVNANVTVIDGATNATSTVKVG